MLHFNAESILLEFTHPDLGSADMDFPYFLNNTITGDITSLGFTAESPISIAHTEEGKYKIGIRARNKTKGQETEIVWSSTFKWGAQESLPLPVIVRVYQ